MKTTTQAISISVALFPLYDGIASVENPIGPVKEIL